MKWLESGDLQLTDQRAHAVPPEPELLTRAAVCRRLGIDAKTWWRWRQARRAPAPVPNVPGWPRWRRQDIEAFERGDVWGGRRYFRRAG